MTVMHLRARDADGGILSRGGMTIVARENGGTVDLAAAVCSPDDNFCRRVGRNIASGRLESAATELVYNSIRVPLDRPLRDIAVTFAASVAAHNRRHERWLMDHVVAVA